MTASVKRKYFGTDGIRGTVGVAPITPDFVLKLAHAVGRVLKQREERPTVVIGKDTRISGYMLESALESGFNSAGVDVLLLGPLPTPGVAYLTRAMRASLGVVISASHNAYPDNGIKFFSAQGTKLDDAWELAVEALVEEPPQWVDSHSVGRARRLDDAAGRYIEFCKSTFPNDLTLKNLRIVVDGAHGAAYHIAPLVFHELGAEVVSIGCAPDGFNINDEVGATHPKALIAAVKTVTAVTAAGHPAPTTEAAKRMSGEMDESTKQLAEREKCMGEMEKCMAAGDLEGSKKHMAEFTIKLLLE